MIFVNPVVTVLDNKSLVPCEEGCLSIPGASVEVTRPDKIRLNWVDIDGEHHEASPEGLLAVCIQHEIDHLEGKLLVDYLSPLKRARLKDKATK
jgi:peptide deformylase